MPAHRRCLGVRPRLRSVRRRLRCRCVRRSPRRLRRWAPHHRLSALRHRRCRRGARRHHPRRAELHRRSFRRAGQGRRVQRGPRCPDPTASRSRRRSTARRPSTSSLLGRRTVPPHLEPARDRRVHPPPIRAPPSQPQHNGARSVRRRVRGLRRRKPGVARSRARPPWGSRRGPSPRTRPAVGQGLRRPRRAWGPTPSRQAHAPDPRRRSPARFEAARAPREANVAQPMERRVSARTTGRARAIAPLAPPRCA